MEIGFAMVRCGNFLLGGGGGGCFVLIAIFATGSIGLGRRLGFGSRDLGQMGEFVNGIGTRGVVLGGIGERFFEFVAFVFEKFGEHHLDGNAEVVSILVFVERQEQDDDDVRERSTFLA